MSSPKVYKSTDSGAPIFYPGTVGSLLSLLDAVLVDGYGTQQPLGWTKEFFGGNKTAYMPKEGSRRIYRFDNNSYKATDYYYYKVQCFDSMTDINTGLGGTGDANTRIHATSGTVARPWIIIGDGYGFYLWIDTGDRWEVTNRPNLSYFGDAIPLSSQDGFCSLVSGGYSAESFGGLCFMNAPFSTSVASYQTMKVQRRLSGDSATIGQYVQLLGSACAVSKIPGSSWVNAAMSYPFDGKLLRSRVSFSDGNQVGTLRGFVPGLWCPEHNNVGLTNGATYIDGAVTLLCLSIYGQQSDASEGFGFFLIDISDTFRV